jgi:iron(III) transport system substrate-binding protein
VEEQRAGQKEIEKRGSPMLVGKKFSVALRWFLLLAAIVFWLLPPAHSQQTDRTKLVEEAKREGEMMWYTTMALDDSSVLVEKFKEKYPFITVKLYRSNNEKLLQRFLNEARAGAHLADVITADGLGVGLLKEAKLLQKYLSPEREAFPKGAKDPDGYWTDTYVNTFNLVYNTQMVPPNNVPKKYEELADPKWRGELSLEQADYEWLGGMLQIFGEEKGLDFMRKLAAQNPVLRAGHSLLANLVAAGEFALYPDGYPRRVEVLRERGSRTVDWVWLEPVIAQLHPAALPAKTSHPNAAKLFIDYLLSREGQELIGLQFGRLATRPGVKLKYPRMSIEGRKVHWSDPSVVAKNANRYAELFQGIFVQRKTPR